MIKETGRGYFPSTLVLIAALDEEEGIGLTLIEVNRYLRGSRVLVVDGKSKDATVHVAKSLGATVMYQEKSGKGDAIRQALQKIEKHVDFVVFIDADYTYPAVFIPQMIRILEQNPKVGMVCGNRFNSNFDMKSMNDIFYVGNRFLASAHNMLNGLDLHDPLTGLRVVRWCILENWKPKSASFDIEVELNHLVEKRGYEIVEMPIYYRVRKGEKKLRLIHGFTILKRIIAETMH